jgi:DNA replication protein DnaC
MRHHPEKNSQALDILIQILVIRTLSLVVWQQDIMSSGMESLESILRRAQLARKEAVPQDPEPRVCPICQGAGYLRYDVPVGDPRFGDLVVCECTRAELDARRQRMLLEKSQLAALPQFTFERFELKIKGTPPLDSPDGAFHIAQTYVEKLSVNDLPWLFFYGTKGTGKTHLAAAIGHARIARGQPAIFMVVPDLLDHLRATYSPNSDTSYDELFESLRNTPLLILDDLGTHSATPWAQEKLYQLINYRYNLRLPTVITMNMESDEVDPRLWSRINDKGLTTRCEVRSKDRRTDEEQQGKPRQHRPWI